jgi:hypothetical protein
MTNSIDKLLYDIEQANKRHSQNMTNVIVAAEERLDPTPDDVKPTNPKDACGIKKVPISGMPVPVLLESGLVKLHGDLKYGRYNWRDAGVRGSVYYDACFRHLAAWWEGEDLDPDSGIHHLSHAITGLAVLRDAMMQDNWIDDRPKESLGFIKELNKKAEEMVNKHNQ